MTNKPPIKTEECKCPCMFCHRPNPKHNMCGFGCDYRGDTQVITGHSYAPTAMGKPSMGVPENECRCKLIPHKEGMLVDMIDCYIHQFVRPRLNYISNLTPPTSVPDLYYCECGSYQGKHVHSVEYGVLYFDDLKNASPLTSVPLTEEKHSNTCNSKEELPGHCCKCCGCKLEKKKAFTTFLPGSEVEEKDWQLKVFDILMEFGLKKINWKKETCNIPWLETKLYSLIQSLLEKQKKEIRTSIHLYQHDAKLDYESVSRVIKDILNLKSLK